MKWKWEKPSWSVNNHHYIITIDNCNINITKNSCGWYYTIWICGDKLCEGLFIRNGTDKYVKSLMKKCFSSIINEEYIRVSLLLKNIKKIKQNLIGE